MADVNCTAIREEFTGVGKEEVLAADAAMAAASEAIRAIRLTAASASVVEGKGHDNAGSSLTREPDVRKDEAAEASVGVAGKGETAAASVGVTGKGEAAAASVGLAGKGEADATSVGLAGKGEASAASVGVARTALGGADPASERGSG